MRVKPGTLSSGLAKEMGLNRLVAPKGESVQVTIMEESQMGDTEC